MPGYLVDEGGERTHAVLPLDEYERLKKVEERLESVRGYAMEMITAMSEEGKAEGSAADQSAASEHGKYRGEDNGESGEHQEERAWYQRT
ncbi:MAG: hypothetical protein H0U65_10020 [Rubrobacter sp.]|jgi:hypothetical protein|nr:hypothetical protein [Rubrobacter sp.]